MNEVNSLVLCREDYDSQEEFEDNIKTAVMVLLRAGYIMTVRYDEPGLGIIAIDYDYVDGMYGGKYPVWLSPDEADSVIWDEERKEDNYELRDM